MAAGTESADAWPRGLERIAKTLASTRDGSADGDAGGVSCDVSFRAVSSKYPLRVTAASGGVNALGGLAAARRAGAGAGAPSPTNRKRKHFLSGRRDDDRPRADRGRDRRSRPRMTSIRLAFATARRSRNAASPPDPEQQTTRHTRIRRRASPARRGSRRRRQADALGIESRLRVADDRARRPRDARFVRREGLLAMLHVLKALQRRYPPGTFDYSVLHDRPRDGGVQPAAAYPVLRVAGRGVPLHGGAHHGHGLGAHVRRLHLRLLRAHRRALCTRACASTGTTSSCSRSAWTTSSRAS